MQGTLAAPTPFFFLLGLLAVWRLTHLLQAEDGPFDVLLRIREWAGEGVLGRLLDCFYCLSLWVALPVAWLISRPDRTLALTWLALSGGAILAERLTAPRDTVPLPYFEEEEPDHALLRTPSQGPAGD